MKKLFSYLLIFTYFFWFSSQTVLAQIDTQPAKCANGSEIDFAGFCSDGKAPVCASGYTQVNFQCVKGVGNYPVDSGGVGSPVPTGNQESPSKTSTPGSNDCSSQGLTNGPGGLCVPVNRFGGLAGSGSFGDVASAIIRIFLTVAGVIAVVFIIIGGYQYIFSAGNAEASAKGKKTITSAIIGLVVVVLSFLIVTTITELLTSDNVTSTLGGSSGGGSGSGGGGTTQNPIPGD